jgi:GNAT superfamily N-acetyltransferase
MERSVRSYNPAQDADAVRRIWREVGWIDGEDDEKALDVFLESGRTVVADLDGVAECMVNTDPGTLRYLDEELPICCVTGVTTSRIARKRGLATSLTARALQLAEEDGAGLALLGVFEQGFYDRLGFGNGSHEHWYTFDPAQLPGEVEARPPCRLTDADWESVHQGRLARRRTHGTICILSPQITRAEMMWSDHGFGLGYRDDAGTLTHHLWLSTKEAESGPYRVDWMAYRSRDEFLELLALIKSLGDQVRSIRMREPGDILLQDLLREPFKLQQITKASKHEHRVNAYAYWQVRMLDLKTCIERTHLEGEPVSFHLELADPIGQHLAGDSSWSGLAGDYTITLGSESSAASGRRKGLPTLRASVGAFTRMWLGVRSPSGLTWTDEIYGPEELLRELDRVLRLPIPSSDWDF